MTGKDLASRIFAISFIVLAAFILFPTLIRQLKTESFSMKSSVQPEVNVSENFCDPTGVLNLIVQKKYKDAETEFKTLKIRYPEIPTNLAEYFEEFFKFQGYLESNPFDQAEYLIRNYSVLEKYLLKNKKSSDDVFFLSAVIPTDIVTQIYDFENNDVRGTASPILCANFKRLCKVFEDAIVVGLHNEKMTEKDARVFCMKENFCYMRSVLRKFGNKNTRINERREIIFDIVRLKSDYPDCLTETGKFKNVARYLEAVQLECEKRNIAGAWDTSSVTDFTALP